MTATLPSRGAAPEQVPARGPVAGLRKRAGLVETGLAVVVATPFVLWGIAIVRARHGWLAERLPDDAFYYLEIGQRLAAGEGSTFDGLHRTNGYHPLWQGLVAVLGFAFGGDMLVKATLLLSLSLVAAAAALLIALLSRRFGLRAAMLGVAIALHAGAMGLLVNGMETASVLLAVAVLAIVIDAYQRGRASSTAVGFACALLVLSRIDFVLVVPLVPLLLGFRLDLRKWWRWSAAVALPTVPLLVVNVLTFRMLLTVSGALKLHSMSQLAASQGGYLSSGYRQVVTNATYDYARLVGSAIGTPAGSIAPAWADSTVAMGLGVCVAGLVVLAVQGRLRGAASGLRVVGAVLVLKTMIDLLVLPLWATGWYAGPMIVVGGATLVAAAAGVLLAAGRRSPVAGALAIVLAVLLGLPAGVPHTRTARADPAIWQGAIDEVADWLLVNPQPGQLGAHDAGLLGFRLHPTSVVNLDGLVNDGDNERLLESGATPLEILRRNHVAFLVGRFSVGDDRVPACAREVWRSAAEIGYQDPASPPSYAPMRVLDIRCATS